MQNQRASVANFIIIVVLFYSQLVFAQQSSTLSKIFEGEWNLQISRNTIQINTANDEDEEEDTDLRMDQNMLLNVTYNNNVHHTLFSDWQNDKNYQIFIEWDSYTSGELKYIPQQQRRQRQQDEEEEEDEQEEESNTVRYTTSDNDGEEEDSKKLFGFQFLNRTNGYFMSQGTFNGIQSLDMVVGTYQFVITSPIAFVFTIFTNSKEVITVTGTKQMVQQEASFIQKYGITVLMMAVFFFFRLSQSMGFFSPQQPQQQQSQSQGPQQESQSQRPQQKSQRPPQQQQSRKKNQ